MQLSIGMSLLFIVCLAFILVKSTNLVVSAIHGIARKTKTPLYGLAAFLVALSTSFPELTVAISSALSNQAQLSLGNIVGSNIANMSLILGLAALSAGSVRAANSLVTKEVFYVFLIGAMPSLFLIDGSLSRLESMGLLVAYFVYVSMKLTVKKPKSSAKNSQDHWQRMLITIKDSKFEKNITLFIVGMAGMILSAETMVRISVTLATTAQVPVFLIGLLVVAVGTSIPELAFEFVAIKHRESQMAFGNILGSVVANATLILGLTGLISPITLLSDTKSYLLSVIGFVLVFGLFWWFVRTKHRLDRWEGGMLVVIYLIFASIQYLWR